MKLDEAKRILKENDYIVETVKESTSTKNVIDEEYDKLEGIIKKEFNYKKIAIIGYDNIEPNIKEILKNYYPLILILTILNKCTII